MARSTVRRMIPLGYGKYARADRIYALVPLEGAERGERRRTLVYVEGLEQPLVASRSEAAIHADLERAGGAPRRRRRRPGQDALFEEGG